MIKNYKIFKEDNDILNLITESMVYFSPKFREKIALIDSPISQKLLDIEGNDIKDDITFIDFDKRDGMFSFKTMKNFNKSKDELAELSDTYNTTLDDKFASIGIDFQKSKDLVDQFFQTGDDTITKSRNPLKVGRFINSVLPGQFTPGQIEDFTNKYKALQSDALEKVIVVEGEEIAKWYDEKNYFSTDYTLGSSCMRDKPADFFQIYMDNPEICKMACLVDNGKLRARALLWKPTMKKCEDANLNFEWFMDRQYAISDADIQKLRDWAKSKEYAWRTKNGHGDFKGVTWNDTEYKCDMEVKLKNFVYTSFPYVDTFRRYDPDSMTLYNDDNSKLSGFWLLQRTNGGWETTDEQEDEDQVYSDFHGEYIDRDYAVWSDCYDSYLHVDFSVEITSGSRRYRDWYPENADELRWDGWNEEYIHRGDAVWSEEYQYYLLKIEAVSVVNDIDYDGNCNEDNYWLYYRDENYITYDSLSKLSWFQSLKKNYPNYSKHTGIMEGILFRDPETDELIPKDFTIQVHKTDGDIWLSELDMEILEIENYSTYKEMDKISYEQYLLDNEISDKLIAKLEDFGDTLDNPYLMNLRKQQLIDFKEGRFPF